jgi:hypothetical protein
MHTTNPTTESNSENKLKIPKRQRNNETLETITPSEHAQCQPQIPSKKNQTRDNLNEENNAGLSPHILQKN